jgi:hypothetical protein
MKGMTAEIRRRSCFHPLAHEARKLIGTARADTDGTIDVYTFIPEDVAGTKRCWLVGFSCQPVGTKTEKPPALQLSETFTVRPGAVTVENILEGGDVSQLRVSFPMLVFDGKERTAIEMKGNSVKLTLDHTSTRFTVVEPKSCKLQRSGREIPHRNGVVEEAFVETSEKSIVYRITAE